MKKTHDNLSKLGRISVNKRLYKFIRVVNLISIFFFMCFLEIKKKINANSDNQKDQYQWFESQLNCVNELPKRLYAGDTMKPPTIFGDISG